MHDVPSEPAAKRLKMDQLVGLKQEKYTATSIVSNSSGAELPKTTEDEKANAVDEIEIDEVVTKYIKIPELPKNIPKLPQLNASEKAELERTFQFNSNIDNEEDTTEDGWHEDWSGNLALIKKHISNPLLKRRKPHKTEMTLSLLEWAEQRSTQSQARHLGRNLLAHVYSSAPPMAQKILSHTSQSWEQDPERYDVSNSIKRCSYDPNVLCQDGWTTKPSKEVSPEAGRAFGGPAHIGQHINWQGYEAVVIAYVHDHDIGDLWKAMWLDGFETFDVEAEELQAAVRKWNQRKKRYNKSEKKVPGTDATSNRFAATKDFHVDGIEHGVILATTYSPNARQGVFWPARVMHASEPDISSTQRKRSSAKQKVSVVFLAPYWNSGSETSIVGAGSVVGPRAVDYSSLPLFQMESIEVSEDTIQKYPYGSTGGLNRHQLQVAFRFTGLPKNAFRRFLQSHRLAVALKMYATDEIGTRPLSLKDAKAALFDTHALALKVPRFPAALLHLPFHFILSKIQTQSPESTSADVNSNIDPPIDLAFIMKSMEPPHCYGKNSHLNEKGNGVQDVEKKPKDTRSLSTIDSPVCKALASKIDMSQRAAEVIDSHLQVESVLSESFRQELEGLSNTDLPSASLLENVKKLVARCNRVTGNVVAIQEDKELKIRKLRSLLQECLREKSYGEDVLAADGSLLEREVALTLVQWRKACERLIQYVTKKCSSEGFGNGVTVVLSDSRCNQHITKIGCVERPVRLPAALKAAKLAGAGSTASFQFQYGVEDHYMKLANEKFLEKAHTVSYLKKIKGRCAALSPDAEGAHLTEGSDGEGGLDTTGTRGTYDAAVAGVAAAMKAVDLIVGGQCVNAFCATRPPGHHAGRDLHPMGAVSNGFCLLNPVACAAIYATTPPSQGGLGLKRAAVIDFDVHHGNGTQDILCSTYDPRFLYVSMHAGGAQINGYESDDPDVDFPRVGSKKQVGIFPGRCGDKSPHKGVINIPLGPRVTPHGVGASLLNIIEPGVEEFSPDIIILSAGFDGHKNDPLGMGGLSAQDFAHITDFACEMAARFCGGRIFSVLEGGYGVPCCRPQKDIFIPQAQPPAQPQAQPQPQPQPQPQVQPHEVKNTNPNPLIPEGIKEKPLSTPQKRSQPSKLLELGNLLPENMDDQVTPGMQRRLEKCSAEGFMECVRAHVKSLKENNSQTLCD